MKRYFVLLMILMLPSCYAGAQGCSVCTKTASGLNGKGAKGLNAGILYLAAIPLTIMGTLGFAWWKHNKKTV